MLLLVTYHDYRTEPEHPTDPNLNRDIVYQTGFKLRMFPLSQ